MVVPKLRFKEFKDEWKKDALGEVSNIYLGVTYTPTYVEKGKIFISSKDISNGYLDLSNIKYISEDEYSKISNNAKPKKGDVLFTRVGSNLGNPTIVDTDLELTIFVSLGYLRVDKNKLNNKFIKNWMNSYYFWHQVDTKVAGGAKQNLNTGWLNKFTLYLPNIIEQEKIANFLSLLDKKIELQQKKINALKIYKTGLIQKLKSNSQNWTEYKIGILFNITRGQVIPKNNLRNSPNQEYKYPVYSSQTSNYGILGYDKTYDFDGEFLTWTTDGANAGKVFYRNGKFRCTNVCGILYSSDNSPYINLLTADLLNYETPKHVSYVGNPKLMNNVMADIKIKLPSLEIQNKISNIFSILNNKLFIEHKKLDNLNIMKKALLQQMFI